MPDVYLPNGIVQPAIGSTAWGAKQHANLALMDPLFARVAALEAAIPAEFLPSGTTFTQLLEAIADTPAGGTVILPNEPMEQSISSSSVLWVSKPFSILGHPGGLSELVIDGNVGDYGTSHQIAIAESAAIVGKVHLGGFKMTHNRVASPDMRTCAIDLWRHCTKVEIDHIELNGITSDFFLGRPYPWHVQYGCEELHLHHCFGAGFWEGFYNWHAGWLLNENIHDNHVTESTMHLTYQGPMGIEHNVEQEVGGIVKFNVFNNSFVMSGTASYAGGNTIGLGYVEASNMVKGDVYYTEGNLNGNIFDGFNVGAYFPTVNYSEGSLPARKTLRVLQDNQLINCGTAPLHIWPDSTEYTPGQVVGNAWVRGTGTYSFVHWATSFAADQEVYAEIDANITGAQFFIRSQTGSIYSDGYNLVFANATTARIYSRVSGVVTVLGADISITHSAGNEWKFRAVGSTLTVYKGGVLQATRTDSDVPGGGYLIIGITTGSMNVVSGGNVGSSGLLDNFNRANENPVNPTNWVGGDGARTGSANDRIVLIRNIGNGNPPLIDQSRLTGSLIQIDQIDNAWT